MLPKIRISVTHVKSKVGYLVTKSTLNSPAPINSVICGSFPFFITKRIKLAFSLKSDTVQWKFVYELISPVGNPVAIKLFEVEFHEKVLVPDVHVCVPFANEAYFLVA